jgi:hypothetical protein
MPSNDAACFRPLHKAGRVFGISLLLQAGFLMSSVAETPTITPSPSAAPSPSPSVQNPNNGGPAPVKVFGCGLSGAKWILGKAPLKAIRVPVDFENLSDKTANQIVFDVAVNGVHIGQLIDNGSFAPKIEVKHPVDAARQMSFKANDAMSCLPIRVTFLDGTVWSNGQAAIMATTILEQPDSPIRITKCLYAYTNPQEGNYDMDTAVWFENTQGRTAVAVRFGFITYSAFDEVLGTHFGTLTGEFSSNVLIEPGYNPSSWTAAGPQPGNAVWRFPSSTNAVRLSCFVDAAKFTDGSKWMRAKS